MAKKLVELAKLAGVSPATVSLVYSNSPLVAKKTREKVIKAGLQHGYIPNAAARAVRQGKFNRIAGVVVQYGPKGTTYTPNSGYFDTAADCLAEAGYSLVLEPMHMVQLTDEFIDPPKLFKELAIDGILGLPATGYIPPVLDEQLSALGSPVVWLNRKSTENANWVYCDEITGARRLTRYLIDQGHQRIGYFGFAGLHYSVTDRFEGFLAEMKAAGLDTSSVALTEREAPLVEEAKRLLDQIPSFTAIICFQRLGYEALLHLAAQRGIRVPQDLSLCYFATSWEVLPVGYPVTTMRVPESEMAAAGVKILLDLIEGRSEESHPRSFVGTLQEGLSTTPHPDCPA